jgi:hypothetical protein
MVKRESTSGTGFGAEGPMFKDYKGKDAIRQSTTAFNYDCSIFSASQQSLIDSDINARN